MAGSSVFECINLLYRYLAVLEQLEKKASEKGDGAGKQQLRIVPHTRLLPTRPNQRNVGALCNVVLC